MNAILHIVVNTRAATEASTSRCVQYLRIELSVQRNILGETRRLFHEPCASVKRTTGKNWATNGREKERAEWQRHRRDGGRVQPTAEAAAAAATRGRAVRSKARKWNRLAVTLRQPSSVARPRAMAGAFCCPLASDSNSRGRTENWRARDGERERETADSPCILDSRACVVAVGFVRLRWNRRRRWQRARQRRERAELGRRRKHSATREKGAGGVFVKRSRVGHETGP